MKTNYTSTNSATILCKKKLKRLTTGNVRVIQQYGKILTKSNERKNLKLLLYFPALDFLVGKIKKEKTTKKNLYLYHG